MAAGDPTYKNTRYRVRGNPSSTPGGKKNDTSPAPTPVGAKHNPSKAQTDTGRYDVRGNPNIGQGLKVKNLGAQTRRGGGPGGERA